MPTIGPHTRHHGSARSSSFPWPLRLPRCRRHSVSVLKTVVVVVVFALPAYVFLILHAPGTGLDADTERSVHPPGAAPNGIREAPPHPPPHNLHIRETDQGFPGESIDQVVLRRGALQVGQGQEQLQSSGAARRSYNETTPSSKWKMFGRINASYSGCYPDSVQSLRRTLRGAFHSDVRRMTIEMCLSYCIKRNYKYAGLQFYSECYCGSILGKEKLANNSKCNLECSGDKSQMCGGAPFLSVYQLQPAGGKLPIPSNQRPHKKAPVEEEGLASGFVDGYRTCAERPTDSSYFSRYAEDSDVMTVKMCLTICEKQGMPLAALFRGSQCHCGFLTRNYTLRHTVEASECQEPCKGDPNVYCGGKIHYAIYQTNVEDTRCTTINLGRPKEFPLIAVASFPGSGNTWVRYLIERTTGYFTGSYYDDGDLYRKGFRGEREHWLKGNTVAVKTHRFDEEHVSTFDGAILVIRNPYKAIISEHNRKFGGHTGFATEKHYTQGTEWIDFVSGKSRTWTNTALNFLQYSKKVLVIHYEDLRKDPYIPLQKMARFLGQPLNEERLLCTLSSPDGKFKRPESSRRKLTFDPYTDEMKEFVGLYIKTVTMALQLKNQTTLPDEYNPHLNF